MINRLLGLGFLLLLALAPAAAAAKTTLTFHYLYRAGDPLYQPQKAYTGLVLRDLKRPLDAVKSALRDSRIVGRSLGISFALAEHELGDGQDPAAAIEALRREGQLTVVLLDLDAAEMAGLGRRFAAAPDLLLLNFRDDADALRGAACSPALFHTIPSRAMTSDALAQFLADRDWKRVLLLVGEAEDDAVTADAFERAARKFGLTIADRRTFVLGHDPRRREETNIALLTGDARYDVVFLADSLGEFGRYVPYATYDPRPVVGSEGLSPAAWHWAFERFGAPQLNQRFERAAGRRMTALDWAAWAAVKAVVEAVVRVGGTAPDAVRAYLRSDAFALDLYKGVPGSFRPWDQQLRQPILLHTHNAVIATAPLESFLHEGNTLDSLGADKAESACALAAQ